MQIYKKRLYWMKGYIITGAKAARECRSDIALEAQIKPEKRYRLYDGHLKSFCPVVDGLKALEFLKDNPFQRIEEVL